jgi:hypothetical protein
MAFFTSWVKESDRSLWLLRHSVPQETTSSLLTTEKTNGTNILCLVLKISKISKISGVEKFNAFFVRNSNVKRRKCFYFRNNCTQKRQKLKITLFDTCMLESRKQKNLFTFFWFWLQQDLKFFFVCLMIDFLPKLNRQFPNKKN